MRVVASLVVNRVGGQEDRGSAVDLEGVGVEGVEVSVGSEVGARVAAVRAAIGDMRWYNSVHGKII